MLINTFQHIHGIGPKTEADLWSRGIYEWDDIDKIDHKSVLSGKFYFIKDQIEESKKALQTKDFSYFAKRLPSKEHWRIYFDAILTEKYPAAFIDIETSFSNSGEQYISTIALYDGKEIQCFIRGHNLWDFPEFIKKYCLIVTYSGKTFDIPFMENHFRMKFTNTHIDLRYVLSGMGIKGGLKKCERILGFHRNESEGIEGSMAPFLWNAFERGKSLRHLHTLLAYNIEDVLGLYHIIHKIFEDRIKNTPFKDIYRLDYTAFPQMPYRADRNIIENLTTLSFNNRASSHHA
ncbi:ribonuclease H-like domain-containing protein [Desulforegula conservatrix]|uniref:ribonuclease H-like domain-containing protein n=1 Tax=Desulforegula conservatrix TaxID=153026 RepID=UPI00040AB093|nr:ribonuclease H-like domain-containing protein [Desulforegula conservatrix]